MTEVSETGFFDRPATLGDVVGWILAFQLVVFTFIMLRVPSAIEKFKPMFEALRGEMTSVSEALLKTPAFVWLVIPLALTGSVIWILVKSRNGMTKVVVSACAYFIELMMVGWVLVGIFYPILQLQSAVRGS